MADQDKSDVVSITIVSYGEAECEALQECIDALGPLAASDPEAIERIMAYLHSKFRFSLDQVRKARKEARTP